MYPFLARRWFLLALVIGVVGCVLVPAAGRLLLGWLPARGVVAAALFLMAISLESRQLGKAMARPWAALWGWVVSFGVVPPLALLAGGLLAEPADYRVGLLLVASSPCTLASAIIWTRRAGGNDATALLIVVLTTGTSWLITPLWLALLSGPMQADFTAMMFDLLLVLIVPVGLGQLLRILARVRETVGRWKRALGVVSQLLVLAVLLKGTAEAALGLQDQLTPAAAWMLLVAVGLSLAVHLAGLFVGLLGARRLGLDPGEQKAIAFAGSQKSMPVALLLFERYLQPAYPLALVPVVCYHLGQLLLDTVIADRMRPPEPERPPSPEEADLLA